MTFDPREQCDDEYEYEYDEDEEVSYKERLEAIAEEQYESDLIDRHFAEEKKENG